MLTHQLAVPLRHAVLLSLCVVLAWLPTVSTQATRPSASNVTLPLAKQFALTTPHAKTGFDPLKLDPLTDVAGMAGNIGPGPVTVTDSAQDAENNLTEGEITFISCDPSFYPGNLVAADTITHAVSKNPIAIILYSSNFTQCSFNETDNFNYTSLYTTISPISHSSVEGYRSAAARIMLFSKLDNDNTGSSSDAPFTKSPTTAVAMIILYSITGIITALFLVIIVVGAIRAHRHPERYGPRHVIGRPRQSRAKGIARAMLETLPIVKFGDKDDKPITSARDIELGRSEGANPTGPPPVPATKAPIADGSVHTDEADTEPELVKTETVDGPHDSERRKTQDGTDTDNGLACSVCTDDFVKGQDIRVLPCDHRFHPECIDPWLLNVSGTCPLCRVDLRPTTVHSSEPDLPESPHITSTHPPTNFDALDSSSTVPPVSSTNGTGNPPTSTDPAPHANRRSRTGLSVYLQNTLNRRRMRDATPEERLQALRTLRTANRARESESADVNEQRPRNRVSVRLSRAFNSTSRPSSGVPVVNPRPAPGPADLRETQR